MVAVFNKELLSWYLITLKLKETVEGGLPKSPPITPTTRPSPAPAPAPVPAESEWIISIREKLDQARQDEDSSPWAKLSIYRVPKSLRDVGDEKAYVPQVVSIGPFHRGKRRLREMDRHKWRSLHMALRRTRHDVRIYLDAVRDLEEKARFCYEGQICVTSDEFVETMVLDGCFVLELFRGAAGGGEGFRELGYSPHDPVFAMRGSMHAIQCDMIMLENQIPLFVLDRILGIQIGCPEQIGMVARLALRFFDPLVPTDEPLRKNDRHKLELSLVGAADEVFDPLSDRGLHCLDVFRRSLLRPAARPMAVPWMGERRRRWSRLRRGVADKRRQQLVHCVTELREAGVKLRRRKTDRFWDVAFRDGVLEIPRLLIHDGTRSLLLNLIAFEQCHHMESSGGGSSDITSYVIFMDNLINSEEDVRYLHYRGIVEHWLGNDAEVADLFNRLCQEVVFDVNDSYLSSLSSQVNRYYDHRWNAWRASLKHNYFSNPWAIISLVAAVVLLLLTAAQTFYSVYGYYRPPR